MLFTHRVIERGRRQDVLRYFQADLLELVDEPSAHHAVRLVHAAVEEHELETLRARFLEQPSRLGPGLIDIGPIAGDLRELFFRRRQGVAREDNAADRLHDGDLRQIFRARPAIDRQGERAAHADVVEGLPPVIRQELKRTVPVAFLNDDFVAQRLDQIVARLGREAAELDGGLVAADRLQAHRHLRRGDRPETVQIRLALVVVVLVALAFDVGARLMFDESEGARTVDVLLVPGITFFVQILLRIDEVVGRGHGRQERA